MAVQIVMDRGGDSRHEFDLADPVALKQAEERFRKLTRKGFRAVALGEDGKPGELQDRFNPTVEKTLFIPHLQGG